MVVTNILDWLMGLSRTLAKINLTVLWLVFMILVLAGRILLSRRKKRSLLLHGEEAQGTVIGMKKRLMFIREWLLYSKSTKLYRIKFVDGSGKEFTVDHIAPAILYEEGDVVQVVYDPADPYEFIVR